MSTMSQPVSTERADDDRAVHACWATLVDAWNRGDGAAYAGAFTADCDYVAFDGTRLIGRDANARAHQALFGTVLHGSRLVGEIKSIRYLGDDVAIVHASGAVLMPWQTKIARRRRSRQTLVLVKRHDRWWGTAFHHHRIAFASGACSEVTTRRGP
jgi:uncharacterized protein (TIGR02246 family)